MKQIAFFGQIYFGSKINPPPSVSGIFQNFRSKSAHAIGLKKPFFFLGSRVMAADAMAAAEIVIGSSGTTTGIEVIELIDLKSMTAAMETANKVVSAYQAPNK